MTNAPFKTLEGRDAVALAALSLGGTFIDLQRPDHGLPAGAAASAHLLSLLKNQGLVSIFCGPEDAVALTPALRKIREEKFPIVLHVAVDDANDLLPLAAQDIPLVGSASAQEASDIALIAGALARAVRAPVVHFFDRRWVGGEFAKIMIPGEDDLRRLLGDAAEIPGDPSHVFDTLCARFRAATGRSYSAFSYDGAPDATGAGVALVSDTTRRGGVRVRLWRPFQTRRFLESFPSTVESLAVAKSLHADTLSAVHQGVVGGWSWFVNLPPLLPIEDAPTAPPAGETFQASIRIAAEADVPEVEAALRETIADLAKVSNAHFQIYATAGADGAQLHLRIAAAPITVQGPVLKPDVSLALEGSSLSWTDRHDASVSGRLDAEEISRRAGLGRRLGPSVVSVLLRLLDCERFLGIAESRARDSLNEAVQDRWADFSDDIVAAHRRALEMTRREMSHPGSNASPNSGGASIAPLKRPPQATRVDLQSDYLGFRLSSPLIACVNGRESDEERTRLAGAPLGAVFFGPVSERELDREAWKAFETIHRGVRPSGSKMRPPIDVHIERLRAWKESVEVPVIAGLAAASEKNWLALAFALEQGGADALEVFLSSPEEGGPADPLRLLSLLSAALKIPVAARVSPGVAGLGLIDNRDDLGGVKALVLFRPPVAHLTDPDTLEPREEALLTGAESFRLALPQLARLSERETRRFDLAAAGPVSSTSDFLSALLCGAKAVYVASEVHTLARLEETLRGWMSEKGFAAIGDLAIRRGQIRKSAVE